MLSELNSESHQGNSGQVEQRICLIIPYFGQWPEYFQLFLNSIEDAQRFDVLIFSDIAYHGPLPARVKIISFSLEKINQLISDRLEINAGIIDPYKLCDFRPCYGILFSEFITQYSHWAFGDLDVLYGKTNQFIPEDIGKYDVLTFREEWLSGSFTALRNNAFINAIFKQSKSHRECFLDPKHRGFDECYGLYGALLGSSSEKILDVDANESFSWVVRNAESKGDILVYRHRCIKESITLFGYVIYANGSVVDESGRSYFFYHYITEKKSKFFSFPLWQEIPQKFYINNFGFFRIGKCFRIRFPLALFRAILVGGLRHFIWRCHRVFVKINQSRSSA